MKWQMIIGVSAAILMRCSSGGSEVDLSGGGVIGNPAMPGLAYTDTIHCRVVTKSGGQVSQITGTLSPLLPLGSDSARINQKQRYDIPGASGAKRFRFAALSGEQFSSWSPDSVIEWTWTTAGICSVQVQRAENADTSAWSEPLIVHIIE